jgi:hypothetical protein
MHIKTFAGEKKQTKKRIKIEKQKIHQINGIKLSSI